MPCTHLDHVRVTELPEAVAGCGHCRAEGGQWVHLRICLECGHVGCCDSSPGRHASGHARAADHPIMRSLAPGEEGWWCSLEGVGGRTRRVGGETRPPPSPLLGWAPPLLVEGMGRPGAVDP